MDSSDRLDDVKPKNDTTYKMEIPQTPHEKAGDDSPSTQAPEKLFPGDGEKNSSKEVIHDAPEVVTWLEESRRPTSPFSEDGTVVSGFPPMGYDEKGDPIEHSRRGTETETVIEKPKTCGLPRRYFMAALILIWVVLLAIGLGVGLGVGLKKDNEGKKSTYVVPYCAQNPDYCIGGALGTEYYTKTGAFNGTGIALATEFWNHEERKIMTVYFQHWTGEIRSTQLTPQGQWIGGTQSEVIATDAKNATPISIVSYALNGTAQWHIFYINKINQVRQKVNTNATNIWQEGPLNLLNLTAYDAPNVGLQACWYGNYYGDSDASKFPTYDGKNNTIPFGVDLGMHLWYPTNETTFEQYGWYEGQKQWVDQDTWPNMNAHGGVGCYSWGPGSVTYAMMLNRQNSAEIWWKDTDTNLTATSEHPINAWKNATGYAINNLYPSSSLGYTEYFYGQNKDGSIGGHFMNWDAENTTSSDEKSFTVGSANGPVLGLKGTHMSVTAVGDQSGGKSLYVFYQTRGDDLSVFIRDIKGGQWTQGELPIPDT